MGSLSLENPLANGSVAGVTTTGSIESKTRARGFPLSRICPVRAGTNKPQRREERREKRQGEASDTSRFSVEVVQLAGKSLPLHCNTLNCSQAARKSLAGPQASTKTGRLKTGKWDPLHFPVFNFPVSPGLGCGFAALRSSRLCGLLELSSTADRKS